MAKKPKILFAALDPSVLPEDLAKLEKDGYYESPLVKSISNSLENNKKITRLAFEEDPTAPNKFGGLYFDKFSLLPDKVIKRISVIDDLVATIVRARGNQCASFGHELQDRFSTGFRIEPDKGGKFESLSVDEKAAIFKKIVVATKKLSTCGNTKKWSDQEHMTLPTFLYLSGTNAVRFGRFATEIIWATNKMGEKEFYAFRPSDVGTIYKALPKNTAAAAVRKAAIKKLESIKNEKLIPEKFENDEYAWIQVIEGTPQQAFTEEEMIVHNCYPITDIEYNGYPLTPIDTAYNAIVTHLSIVNHNKLYFQNGRAAKGMLVIQSDDVDTTVLSDLKQQFNANINSTTNAWRMPVIKVGQEDTIEWKAIDSGARDMEFQYLSDSNARVILSAFHMSPEELPGYAHLSRGTNNQALSESNNEYKLEAARDVGIRPLLASMEDFLNSKILPLIDEEVAKYCSVKLTGLDADNPEKESTRIEAEQQLHGSMNDTLRTVDKPEIPKAWGGDLILNPIFGAKLDQYFTVGQIKEYFLGHKNASKDPKWDYARDPFYFQNAQILQGQQQMEEQQKMAQAQAAQGQAAQGGQPQEGQPQQGQPQQQDPNGGQPPDELTTGIDQLIQTFSKSEKDLDENKRKLLGRHNAIVKEVMDQWHKESETMMAELSQVINKNKR